MLHYSIDSMKIRFPLGLVKIINPLLSDKWVDAKINLDTGEFDYNDGLFKPSALKIEEKGVKTRYLIEKISNGKTCKCYVCILVNAKILGKKYLAGISRNNVNLLYNSIMQQKVIYIPINKFLEGLCTDVDFKSDISLSNLSVFEKMIDELSELTTSSNCRGKGKRIFRSNSNHGIEWSDRRLASPSNPYIKIYHKTKELEHNSTVFYNEYIKGNLKDENLVRVEYTLKSRRHLKEGFKDFYNGKKRIIIKSEDNRLKHLLTMDQKVLAEMGRQILNKHLITGCNMCKTNKTGLSPAEIMMVNTINHIKSNKRGIVETVHILTSGMDRINKSKYKKKIINLWDYENDDVIEKQENKEVADVLHTLGVF